MRRQAQGSEILPCLGQGVLCFLLPAMYLLWWGGSCWMIQSPTQPTDAEPDFPWQLGMGDGALNPRMVLAAQGSALPICRPHLALSEERRRGHGWQGCPRTPSTSQWLVRRQCMCEVSGTAQSDGTNATSLPRKSGKLSPARSPLHNREHYGCVVICWT